MFNATLVGKGGGDLFVAFWGKRNVDAVKSPGFRAVAETYRRLKGYVDPGSPGRNWNDATTLVIQGKAGMQIMGDWAKGEFTAAGQTAGREYGCTVLSDHGTGYVMGGDVFAFPKQKSADATKAQTLLATVMLEPATQTAFALKKLNHPLIFLSRLQCGRMVRPAIAPRSHPAAQLDWFACGSVVASHQQQAASWRLTARPDEVMYQLQMRGVMS